MEECHSRQLRPKTMLSYEHTLRLFSFWLTGRKKISRIEDIKANLICFCWKSIEIVIRTITQNKSNRLFL